MTIDALGSGVFLFILIFLIHLFIWHFFAVKKEILILFSIFIGIPLIPFIFLLSLELTEPLRATAAGAIYFSLAIAYMQTYPLLREVIPSFRILLLIHQQGARGMGEAEIVGVFKEDERFFLKKIQELEKDSLIRVNKQGYLRLSLSGGLLAAFFIFYRRLLGLKWGQG